jgi:hypothetical protein
VGVRVDEAGRDDESRGLDDAASLRAPEIADRRDGLPADAHVGAPAGRTRAVDDRPTPDHEIEHGDGTLTFLSVASRGCGPKGLTGPAPTLPRFRERPRAPDRRR